MRGAIALRCFGTEPSRGLRIPLNVSVRPGPGCSISVSIFMRHADLSMYRLSCAPYFIRTPRGLSNWLGYSHFFRCLLQGIDEVRTAIVISNRPDDGRGTDLA